MRLQVAGVAEVDDFEGRLPGCGVDQPCGNTKVPGCIGVALMRALHMQHLKRKGPAFAEPRRLKLPFHTASRRLPLLLLTHINCKAVQ